MIGVVTELSVYIQLQDLVSYIILWMFVWTGVVGAVGKIPAFRLQGPQFNPDTAEIWIFVWPPFPPKLTQLSILLGYVNE